MNRMQLGIKILIGTIAYPFLRLLTRLNFLGHLNGGKSVHNSLRRTWKVLIFKLHFSFTSSSYSLRISTWWDTRLWAIGEKLKSPNNSQGQSLNVCSVAVHGLVDICLLRGGQIGVCHVTVKVTRVLLITFKAENSLHRQTHGQVCWAGLSPQITMTATDLHKKKHCTDV